MLPGGSQEEQQRNQRHERLLALGAEANKKWMDLAKKKDWSHVKAPMSIYRILERVQGRPAAVEGLPRGSFESLETRAYGGRQKGVALTLRRPTYTRDVRLWQERQEDSGWMALLALLSVMWNMTAYLPVRR